MKKQSHGHKRRMNKLLGSEKSLVLVR